MLLLKTNKLPEGKDWLYEIKLDGYRALALKYPPQPWLTWMRLSGHYACRCVL
jgi:hypothetical protein